MIYNKKGMSYVEIMTVIAIIMILSTIAMANVRGSGSKSTLFISAQKIITDLRRVQNDALSSKEFEGESPAGGWGIFFDKSLDHYTVFADKAEDPDIGLGDHVCLLDCGALSEEYYEDIPLPEGSVIDQIYKIRSSDGAKIPATKVNVVFEPPNPTIHLCETKVDCDYDRIGIVIINQKFDKREITVNFFGLVDTLDVYY